MTWKMDETDLSAATGDSAAQVDYRERENWTTPVKAIRRKCMDCCAGSRKLVRECHIYTCPLWPFRLGKRPKTVESELCSFPDKSVFHTADPLEATDVAGRVSVDGA